MNPHHKWISADIARHTARAEADDLESLWVPRERPILTRRDKLIIAACVAAALCVIAKAVFAMPIQPAPYTGPGFEVACQKGC